MEEVLLFQIQVQLFLQPLALDDDFPAWPNVGAISIPPSVFSGRGLLST